jgi:hypothetical protein
VMAGGSGSCASPKVPPVGQLPRFARGPEGPSARLGRLSWSHALPQRLATRVGIASSVLRSLCTLRLSNASSTLALTSPLCAPSARQLRTGGLEVFPFLAAAQVPQRTRRPSASSRGALSELRLLQSLTIHWRPRLCCSYAVPSMRFLPLQRLRATRST